MSGGGVLWVAAALGVVEGLTEFVPVSSTGHLILVGHWLAFPAEKAATFEIFIQLGAVLAVIYFFRTKLLVIARTFGSEPAARRLVGKVFLAFLPAAAVGLLVHGWIVRVLFEPLPVAAALAVGGLALIAVDGPRATSRGSTPFEDLAWRHALVVGLWQVTALWPGVSRSGATIIGGLVAGLSRTAALEFSFFLAIPTLGAASLFALWQARATLVLDDLPVFGLGLAISFLVSLVAIAGLLGYVRRHDLRIFGWYRLIVAGLIVLLAA